MTGKRAEDEFELALWRVDIAVNKRADGRYVARVAFDDEAGWEECVADTPERAFEQMVRVARRRLEETDLTLA